MPHQAVLQNLRDLACKHLEGTRRLQALQPALAAFGFVRHFALFAKAHVHGLENIPQKETVAKRRFLCAAEVHNSSPVLLWPLYSRPFHRSASDSGHNPQAPARGQGAKKARPLHPRKPQAHSFANAAAAAAKA